MQLILLSLDFSQSRNLAFPLAFLTWMEIGKFSLKQLWLHTSVIERVKSQWFGLKMWHKRLDLESRFAGALRTGSYQPAALIWLLTLATAETEREKWEVAIDWQSIGIEVLSSAPGKVAHSPANCSLQIPEGMLRHGIAAWCTIRPML